MRKAFLLLCACLMLWTGCAVADVFDGSVRIGEAEQDTAEITFTVWTEQDRIAFASSLCPGWLMQTQYGITTDAFTMDNPMAMLEAMTGIFTDWEKMTERQHKTGLFTGDLFDTATQAETVQFSWGELALLLNLAEGREELPQEIAELLPEARKALTEAAAAYPKMRFVMNIYDEITALSLSAVNDGDTVATLSARSEDGSLHAVAGHAENGTTYYLDCVLRTGANAEEMTVQSTLWADGQGAGYKNLPQNAMVLRDEMHMMKTGEQTWSLRYQATGGNGDSILGVTGEMTAGDDFHATASVTAGKDNKALARIAIRRASPDEASLPQEAKVLNLTEADDAQLQAWTADLVAGMTAWLPELFKQLPAEWVIWLLSIAG